MVAQHTFNMVPRHPACCGRCAFAVRGPVAAQYSHCAYGAGRKVSRLRIQQCTLALRVWCRAATV